MTLEAETMPKKDFQAVSLQAVQSTGGVRLNLSNFAELEKFSHFMAISKFVPKHLREKQADCLAVLLQAMRWEMDPFTVAQKTYFVNELIGYEAQLINALINSRAGLKARPDIEWSGEGEGLKCKVTATFIGESKPKEFEAEIKPIKTRNSPLWVQQPKQQLAYFALRAWARIHCPDVIMGLYTKEEIEDTSYHHGADNALDVTPKESSVLDSLNSAINQAKTADVETKPAATPAAPEQNVQDYLDDIATAPTAEGVAFKFTDAVELFSDAKDYSLLVKARDARILELENFNASKSEVPAFLRKGMFSEQ